MMNRVNLTCKPCPNLEQKNGQSFCKYAQNYNPFPWQDKCKNRDGWSNKESFELLMNWKKQHGEVSHDVSA